MIELEIPSKLISGSDSDMKLPDEIKKSSKISALTNFEKSRIKKELKQLENCNYDSESNKERKVSTAQTIPSITKKSKSSK